MNSRVAEKVDPCHMQVESLGRLMAGLSHDMKNHLGIIRESSGLISDAMEFNEIQGDETTLKRITWALETIEKKIVESAEVLHHLSGFAHRSDTPYSSFNLNALLIEEFALLRRFSKLRSVDVDFVTADDMPSIYNNPSLLQHVIYRLYLFAVQETLEGEKLLLETHWEAKHAILSFLLVDISFDKINRQAIDQLIPAIDKLNAHLVVKDLDRNVQIILEIPSLDV